MSEPRKDEIDVREIQREASRLLVRAASGQILLRLEPGFLDPFWVTPGGGLDDGESHEDAGLHRGRRALHG